MKRLCLLAWVIALGVVGCSGADQYEDGAGVIDATPEDTVDKDSLRLADGSDGSGVTTVACEDGKPCDDGDPCTSDDMCQGGICVGGVNVICDGEGPCRLGTCDSEIGGCTYADVTDGTSCDVSCYDEASCVAGACEVVPVIGPNSIVCT